jgi:hypothetical protein
VQALAILMILADVDGAPGVETVRGTAGEVVIYATDGKKLASREIAGELIELKTVRASGSGEDLVLRTVQRGRCGSITTWELVKRRGAVLETQLRLDESVDRMCGDSPRMRYQARIDVPEPGQVRAVYSGTYNAVARFRQGQRGGLWYAVTDDSLSIPSSVR